VFEELLLLGRKEESIALQTRKKTDVPNSMGPECVPPTEVRKFERLLKKFSNWKPRKPPTGVYNCVGHVWASRRTGVYDRLDEWVLRIRDEDGYRVLNTGNEYPRTGDLVTYWETLNPHTNFLHIGIVEMREGIEPSSQRLPFVWSKLDGTSGEVVHYVSDVPYREIFGDFQTEFWTDRP